MACSANGSSRSIRRKSVVEFASFLRIFGYASSAKMRARTRGWALWRRRAGAQDALAVERRAGEEARTELQRLRAAHTQSEGQLGQATAKLEAELAQARLQSFGLAPFVFVGARNCKETWCGQRDVGGRFVLHADGQPGV